MPAIRPTSLIGLVLVLCACGPFGFDGDGDAARVPDGPVEPIGLPPTGPVTVVGRGVSEGVGWRFAVYPSQQGLCLQMETGPSAGGSCGPVPDQGDDGVMLTGSGTGPDRLSYLEVWAGDEVAEVLLRTADGRGIPGERLDLAGTGVDGRLFLVLLHGNVQPVAVVGLDEDGEELGSTDATHALG